MSEQGFQGGIGDTLRELGVAAGEVRSVETVSERPGHRLYRIRTQERSYILKSFPANAPGTEIESYELLRKLAVPTIAVVARTQTALLLEDLTRSETWRLATELDVKDRNTGEAIARWYRNFHEKGADLAADGSEPPPFLEREEDLLDGGSIESTGRKLGLSGLDSWRLAAERIDLLKSGLSCFETTLNYNDFHWTNLAVSRNSGPGMEAVVFDYDLLGIGTRYSDYRNVVGSLSGEAISGFRDVYGSIDPGEETLDRPLATLYALVSAAQMDAYPRWAEVSRQSVLNGDFETDLHQALDLARSPDSPAVQHGCGTSGSQA